MRQQEKWHEIIGPVLLGTLFELVGVECVGGGKHTVVRIFIDKPGGITIDEIAELSRQIKIVLDVEQPIKGLYALELSSPGLERPLFLVKHFKQQIGQTIAIRATHPVDERRNFKGILREVNEMGIALEIEQALFTFNYADIDKAKVIPNITIGGH